MLFHQPQNSVGNYAYNANIFDDVEFLPHFHRNFELIYVISGQVQCTAGEKTALLPAGAFAMILSNEIHSLKSVEESRCWIGVFSGDFVNAFAKKTQGKSGSDFVFLCERSIADFLKIHLLHEQQPPIYLLKACLYAVCNEYERQIHLYTRTDKSGVLMQTIVDYISKNYKNPISLYRMAEDLGYNYHYLSKCFHRIFSMSFTVFLNSYRLEVALALLLETDKDVAEIALESGFQSIRNFNVFFKSYTGTTPIKYRQGMK